MKEVSKKSYEMLTKPELGLYLAGDITGKDLLSEIEELFVCIKEIIK
ncbi:MAG: hypothetical protein KZY61_12185 [Clostridiaceae bacterium]|nr:hypothetical protein [Clostridiaceae bacterium]MBW4859378.1 hypothetical protein [Clostridiaceae bacterium]MBW4869386.1 hypothetical protein [Clostridiaceae bacterium]